jgi:ribosomal protein L17
MLSHMPKKVTILENSYQQEIVGDLHNRRLAASVIRERAAVVKLFEILGPRYM